MTGDDEPNEIDFVDVQIEPALTFRSVTIYPQGQVATPEIDGDSTQEEQP